MHCGRDRQRQRQRKRGRGQRSVGRGQRGKPAPPICHNASASLSLYALLLCLVRSALSRTSANLTLSSGVQLEEYPFIKQIKLHNFMCHPRLTVDFIPEVLPSQLLARPPASLGNARAGCSRAPGMVPPSSRVPETAPRSRGCRLTWRERAD